MRIGRKYSRFFSTSSDVRSMQVSAAVRFVMMWVIYIGLARSGASMLEIAHFELFLFIANLFSFSILNGGKNALLNSVDQKIGKGFQGYFAGTWIVFVIAGFILALLFLVSSSMLESSMEAFGSFPNTILLASYIFLLVSSSVLDFILLLMKRYKLVVIQSVVINGLMVFAALLPIFIVGDIELAFWWMNAVLLIPFFVVLLLTINGFTHIFEFKFGGFVTQSFLPLSFFALLGGLSHFIDGYLVAVMNESAEVFALYRYGARELPLAILLAGGIVSSLIPIAAENREMALNRMELELPVLYLQLFPLGILLILLSPVLYPLVFGADFAASAGIFNIYLLVLISRVLLPQVFLYAAKKNTILIIIGIVEIVVNLVLSILLYHYFGVYGIAWATVIAFGLSKIMMYGAVSRIAGLPIRKMIVMKQYFLYAAALFLAYLVSLFYTSTF